MAADARCWGRIDNRRPLLRVPSLPFSFSCAHSVLMQKVAEIRDRYFTYMQRSSATCISSFLKSTRLRGPSAFNKGENGPNISVTEPILKGWHVTLKPCSSDCLPPQTSSCGIALDRHGAMYDRCHHVAGLAVHLWAAVVSNSAVLQDCYHDNRHNAGDKLLGQPQPVWHSPHLPCAAKGQSRQWGAQPSIRCKHEPMCEIDDIA